MFVMVFVVAAAAKIEFLPDFPRGEHWRLGVDCLIVGFGGFFDETFAESCEGAKIIYINRQA